MSDVNNALQQNTIIFRMGEETGIVIEKTKEQFEQSLFREHYVKAIQIANDIIGRKEQIASSNIIAFCADRGEGKTSCMETVAELLTIKDRFEQFEEKFVENNSHTNIHPDKLLRLPVIDPAYFDEKHNIIELITGMMYESLCKRKDENTIFDTTLLIAKFREVQKALEYIEKASSTESPIYDPLDKVQSLSQGLKLPKLISDLMEMYLKFMDKELLVICIDDIDLNIQYAYRMIEQIRKYLSNRQCLILFASNIEQLTLVVRHSIEMDLYGRIIEGENSESQEMAAKYVTKLLPMAQRINLVHISDLYDYPCFLLDQNGVQLGKWDKVKEAITQLIYAKTRYLFYNNESETSPIVPRNLRSFRHLMKLLTDMQDFHNVQIRDDIYTPSDEDKYWYQLGLTNKAHFKNYFYHDWVVNNLTYEDGIWVETLVNYSDISGVNKFVVQKLTNRFKDYLNFDTDGNNKSINNVVKSIVAKNSRTYNISLGDVFYCILLLQSGIIDRYDEYLLFFVKSFYSMRLYEYYDVITERKGTLHPEPSIDKSVNIYPIDSRFECTNILQRFLNGSYFTYNPNDLMAYDSVSKKSRDLHVFAASNLRTLHKEVLSHFRENPFDNDSEWILKLRICEFFMWVISRKGIFDDKTKAMVTSRSSIEPLFFGEFSTTIQFYVFDVLAPFYNVTNLEYAYNRLGDLLKTDKDNDESELVVSDEDVNANLSNEEKVKKEYSNYSFYQIAKSNTGSLLHLAIAQANKYTDGEKVNENGKEIFRPLINSDKYDLRFNTLLSQSIIRNADVLISVYEQLIGRRDLNRRNKNDIIIRLRSFYNNLKNANMYTYWTGKENSYSIRFAFTEAFVDFLDQVAKNAKLRDIFIEILTTDSIK